MKMVNHFVFVVAIVVVLPCKCMEYTQEELNIALYNQVLLQDIKSAQQILKMKADPHCVFEGHNLLHVLISGLITTCYAARSPIVMNENDGVAARKCIENLITAAQQKIIPLLQLLLEHGVKLDQKAHIEHFNENVSPVEYAEKCGLSILTDYIENYQQNKKCLLAFCTAQLEKHKDSPANVLSQYLYQEIGQMVLSR